MISSRWQEAAKALATPTHKSAGTNLHTQNEQVHHHFYNLSHDCNHVSSLEKPEQRDDMKWEDI